MTTIPTHTLTLSNLVINQAIDGEGEPVLLLHGWGAHVGLVWQLAERLIAKGYRVYALDLPGFGESDAPPQPWSVYDYADFVLAYLDHHSLDRVYLFGHSFGGRLSLILGAKQPERIFKMALANSAGVRTPTPVLTRLRLGLYKRIRDGLYGLGLTGLADNLRESYNRRYGSADYQQTDGTMRQTFVQVVNEDLLPLAAQVRVPTLLFWGDQDEDTPLWQAETLEATIPDAGLVVYPGSGHYSYLENLAETARVMDFFFRQSSD